MHRTVTLLLLTLGAGPGAVCETQPLLHVQPVCGNTGNGIVVGKPRIYDDRMLELLIRSLESEQAATGKNSEELRHQIASLRSLSERALSDRVLMPERGGSPAPRSQALLEFQISLDPKEKYASSVAEVEVTLSTKSDPKQPAAVIAILPKDNSEIVALEKAAPTHEPLKVCGTGFRESDRDLTLAWQFKPAAEADRVDSGTRQVYAMLALPATASDEFLADLHIHSHWRPLKAKKVKHKGSADFLEESVRDELWSDAIRYNPSEMELALRPRVNSVRFVLNGQKEVLVMAEGENFLPDTAISLGNQTFSAAELHIERERHLQFEAPIRILMQADAYMTGRYGAPLPLVDPRALSQQWTTDPAWGLKIEFARARPKDYSQSELRIKLRSRQHKKPLDEMIVNSTLVNVAGKFLPVTNIETDPTDSDASLVHFDLATAALRAAPRLVIARLLGGELYRDSADVVLEDDITVSRVSVLSSTEDEVMLGIGGSGFSNLAVLQIGGATYTRWTNPAIVINGSNMITLRLKRNLLEGARQLTVGQGFAQPLVFPIPEDLSPAPQITRAPPKREKKR